MKNQIDQIPLELGSLRASRGRTLAVMQVCGGSQSFNVVMSLPLLGRRIRMFTIPNQIPVPVAYRDSTRLAAGDHPRTATGLSIVVEELFKFTLLVRGRTDYLANRYSKRNERAVNAINRQIEQI